MVLKPFRYLFLLLAVMAALTACNNESIAFKKGEQYYAMGEYYMASIYYKRSYQAVPAKDRMKRADRAYRMGDCYRRINYTAKAVAAFQNAVRYHSPDSTALFYLAQQQLKMSRYKEAEKNFRTYLEFDPGNKLAANGIESAMTAPEWKAQPNAYTVKMARSFNSRRSDYSPALGGDDSDILYFTSTRPQALGDDINGITGQKNGDVFMVKKDEEKKWKKVEEIEGGLNTEYDEGACCLTPDGKTMYLTRCSTDPDYPRFAEIWEASRSEGSWGKPKKCEITRDTLSSYAHPAVSPDGQWLYFVSDMPGGEGGLDIWRTRILSSGFGGVENLGPLINTAADEMFPTFRPNGEFYFSSNGHVGMGGLDIFKAVNDTVFKEWKVENLRYPMNSSEDDFGMTFEGLHNRGFFCSNRKDGKGYDHLYSFENPEVVQILTGWVYEKDEYELPEALVYMVGDDGTNLKLSVRSDGSFTQGITPGVRYVLLGTCQGYLNVKRDLYIEPTFEEVDTTLQFPLPPINIPVLINNIFYEFDKATLTPESTTALDSLVGMLNDNPNITIELSAHCDYRGNDAYNQRLSQRRAESVVNYLIAHGIQRDRLTAVGYGESRPKQIRKKLAETYKFLHEKDTLTEAFILKLNKEEQEICNALNRRTEFRVLRTTYGLTLEELNASFDKKREEEPPVDD